MALIDEKSRNMLEERFKKEMVEPVNVILFTAKLNTTPEQDETINFMRQILKELSEIDKRISIKEASLFDEIATKNNIKVIPSLIIYSEKFPGKFIFHGTPAGYEIQSLVEILTMFSSGESGIADTNIERLKKIDKSLSLKVFVTPTCPYCPMSVILAAKMSLASDGKIIAEGIEAEELPELSREFQVSSVPQQVINDDPSTITIGAQPEDFLVEQVINYAQSSDNT